MIGVPDGGIMKGILRADTAIEQIPSVVSPRQHVNHELDKMYTQLNVRLTEDEMV